MLDAEWSIVIGNLSIDMSSHVLKIYCEILLTAANQSVVKLVQRNLQKWSFCYRYINAEA